VAGEHFAEPDDAGTAQAAAFADGRIVGEGCGNFLAFFFAVDAAPKEE